MLIISKNSYKIFFFHKINNLANYFSENFFLFNFFFSFSFYNFFFKLQKFNFGHYANNLQKSLNFWTLKNYENLFNKKKSCILNINFKDKLLFNIYFFPIRIVNFFLKKKISKNFFLYSLTNIFNVWTSATLFFQFHLKFTIVNKNAHFLMFYNGFFLNIYHF